MRLLRENLLAQFIAIFLVVLAVSASVLAVVLANAIRSHAVNALVRDVVADSSGRLLRAITPADLEVPMRGERYDRFNRFVQESIVSERVARVKLWAKDGTVIYSDDPAGVGDKFPDNENLLKALRGENAVEIEEPEGTESERERGLGTLMSVYTPIVFPGTTGPQGVFEIYQYYEPTARLIHNLRLWVLGGIGVGFVFIFGSSVAIVWRGWRTIHRQQADLAGREKELRETNLRLEQALDELRATQQQSIQQERLHALGQMASGIAHDFNNALTGILGFSDLLLRSPEKLDDKKTVTEYVQRINTTAKDAAEVVRRMREFYRRREEPEDFVPVNVNKAVEQAVWLTQPKWQGEEEARGIHISVKTDLKEVLPILGNESELREVLTNLIFNAVDAMPGGGTITIRTHRDGEHVVLEVRDTGVGMTEEVRRRCMEPFFTTKGERGTGLGLAVSYGVVRRHDGTIDIESAVGKGTTVTIRLPVQKVQRAEGPREKAEAPSRPLHVLVVDDESNVRDVVAAYLAGEGHSSELAANGREGWEKFRTGSFDLVITDLSMPEMSGAQLAAAIKEMAPDQPVMLLTGFGNAAKASGEKPAEVDFIMGKPVALPALREALAKVAARQRR